MQLLSPCMFKNMNFDDDKYFSFFQTIDEILKKTVLVKPVATSKDFLYPCVR